MTYMHRQASRRVAPATILPGATRAVIVSRAYFQQDSPPVPRAGHVAKYARGRDYHDALRPSLEDLAAHIRSLTDPPARTRVYVDAGPVPERELAQRAGLGWIGKNTMLISPTHGSYFFLATILTDLNLAVDPPFETDRCGTCRRCLDACPTDAFPSPHVLDSRRCISYLTIEHRGAFDAPTSLAGWVFGCDVCQDVCPWNHKFAQPADDPALEQNGDLEWLDLVELSALTSEDFDRRYAATPLGRAGVDGLRRNALAVNAVPQG